MSVEQVVKLDIVPQKNPPHVRVTEYDKGVNGWVITAYLYKDGDPWEPPDSAVASVEGTKANGAGFKAEGHIMHWDTPCVMFTLTESMTDVSGAAWVKIVFTINDSKIATCGLWLDIERAGVEADTIIGGSGFEEQLQTAFTEYLEKHGTAPVGSGVDSVNGKSGVVVLRTSDLENDADYVSADVLSYVTPEQFGAKGDGVTDDTAAFEAALAASDCVYIPSGRYRVNTLVLATGKKLIGESKDSTILRGVATIPKGAYVIETGESAHSCEISGLTIEGVSWCSGIKLATSDNYSETGPWFDVRHTVRDVNLSYCMVGLHVDNQCRGCLIDNVDAYGSIGIAFDINGTDNKIVSCTAGYSGNSGFVISASNNYITNCKAFMSNHKEGSYGFVVSGNYSTISNISIQQNYKNGMCVSGDFNNIGNVSFDWNNFSGDSGQTADFRVDGDDNMAVGLLSVSGRNNAAVAIGISLGFGASGNVVQAKAVYIGSGGGYTPSHADLASDYANNHIEVNGAVGV